MKSRGKKKGMLLKSAQLGRFMMKPRIEPKAEPVICQYAKYNKDIIKPTKLVDSTANR